MGLDIVTNIMADQASNDLTTNQANMQTSLDELSSGYAINTAADDASGLVISQHLQAQIGGSQQAQSNTQAGINVVQTADGALNEVSTILQTINTLAVESQNSSAADSTAQQAAQSEVSQALSSISDIANTTVYGDNQLLVSGSSVNVDYTFQVGYDGSSSSVVAFSVSALTLANLGLVTNDTNAESVSDPDNQVTSVVGLTPGSYSLAVTTSGGTQAVVSGTTALVTSTVINASNNVLDFSLDGTAYSATIAAGTYASQAALVTAVQTAVGTGVTVSLSTGNDIVFTTNDTDPSSATSLQVTGGDAATTLGFSASGSSAAYGQGPVVTINSSTGLALATGVVTSATSTQVTLTATSGSTYTVNLATAASNLVAETGVAVTQNADLVDNSGDITGVQSNIAQGTYNFGVSVSDGTATVTIYNASGVALGSAAVLSSATAASISVGTGQFVDLTLNGALTSTTNNATLVQNYSNPDAVNFSVTGTNAIAQVQAAIQTAASMQGQFGAYQNELQDISDNETVGIQNLTASNASIMDTNMASQMVSFTQDQVLVQAGVSMLAQANQIPQYVLKLLS